MSNIIYKCEECDFEGCIEELDPIKDVHERVLPGEFMAAGQCPECCCLLGIDDNDVPDYTIKHALRIAKTRGLTLEQ